DTQHPCQLAPPPKRRRWVPAGYTMKDKISSWSIRYDPKGNNGGGVITATIGDKTAVCNLAAGHRPDTATFNRFGLLNVMKSADDAGHVWLGDLTVEGERQDLSTDRGWEGGGNRRNDSTSHARPRL